MVDVSIIIPTRNAGNGIDKCLTGIFGQKTEIPYEVIVIDSGSTDNTFAIVNKYPVRHLRIDPAEFGHGKTRNQGAQLARGKYLVYLSQDATPADENWLESLIANFTDDKVAGAYSRWIPKEDCNPLEVRRILEEFKPLKEIRNLDGLGEEDYSRNITSFIHFSNVSSALRKSVWKVVPFNDRSMFAEDQEWAGKVLEAGYSIVYEPRSKVYHSHNYSLNTCFRRGIDGVLFYRRVRKYSLNPIYHVGIFLLLTLKDLTFIWKSKLNLFDKIRWVTYSIVLNAVRQSSVFIGGFRASF